MSKKLLAALSLVAVIALTIPLIAHTEKVSSDVSSTVTPVESTPEAETIAVSTDDEPQVVSLEVTPDGFQPLETTAHKGKFLILLQNRTGRRDLSFYLIRENQERLAQSEAQKRDWKANVQLGPGTYIVGEANHPEWQSVIRVTN